MNIQEYIKQEKNLYNILITFIESNSDDNKDFHSLINFIEKHKIVQNPEEFKAFLYLILTIANNHYRNTNFYDKIFHILDHIKDGIEQNFSNIEIFNFFINNKQILLYLLTNKIIKMDKSIANSILFTKSGFRYCHFFYPEIESFIDEEKKEKYKNELLKIDKNIFDNFNEKRLKGENDSYVCELIRNDLVEDLESYSMKKNLQLSDQIKPSIFETNSFLIKNNPTLIEYAAFFGSEKIFENIYSNGIELESSLWLYAIHGRNQKIIHFLEENHIEPENNSFEGCIKEAIKCHHNEIAKHFLKGNSDYLLKYSFRYYDYLYFPDDIDDKTIFFYMCEFNHVKLVELFLKEKGKEINNEILNSSF